MNKSQTMDGTVTPRSSDGLSVEREQRSPRLGLEFCVRERCYPMGRLQDGTLAFGVERFNPLTYEALSLRSREKISLVEVSSEDLEIQLKNMSLASQSKKNEALETLEEDSLKVEDEWSIDELREKSQSQPVVKLVNDILNRAVAEGATDIHLEPGDNSLKVRYRVDGMLREAMDLPKWVQFPLVSRVKILAELDISEKRLPHDGRIRWVRNDDVVDLRVSTLPTRQGEKVVLRILRHSLAVARLNNLGLRSTMLEHIHRVIHRPQGMIFVTGPTGSGKSSTLYAALREIVNKDINISTIEDPIEYRMEGINQVQVNEKAGLHFAGALRSLLRQDPDVLLVGEIRDEQTAAIAVQAAQTGHLVFSTLHTNDAPSAITRLKDLKVKPFLVSSAVLAILAQRLVRKACSHCVVQRESTEEEKVGLPGLPDSVPQAVGCQYCGHTGYSGRTGIFELLMVNQDVKEAILREESESVLRRLVGMKSLIADGVDKIKEGVTTPEELLRVAVAEE